jgi:nucleoid DNA-binding protein
MTLDQLTRELAARTGLSGAVAARLLAALGDVVATELAAGRAVRLGRRFGAFKPVTRAASRARNPRTGALVELPVRRTVRFKPARGLRHRLQGSDGDGGRGKRPR